jgi:hypothetical protein
MGYISELNKSVNANTLDNDIAAKLYQNVKDDCVELIEDGYKNYLADTDKKFSQDETIITAGLYDHIDRIITEVDLPFVIVAELHQYTVPIKKGKVNPNKAKRFDLHFTHFQIQPRKKIGVEAKLVAENNTASKNATTLVKEYVEDAGMGKFINGLYEDDGFMLGYILNGETDKIVANINSKIISTYSVQEQVKKALKCHLSTYIFNGKEKELYHIFLKFSTL